MDTFELFFQKEYWQEAINHSVEKRLDINLLRKLSYPEERVKLMKLMLSGEYKIKPPVEKFIPKDNGKLRRILVNSKLDRIVLHIANKVYCDKYEYLLSEECYSYKKGVSTSDAVKYVYENYNTFKGYKIDIQSYFDNVSIEVIDKFFNSIEPNPLNDILHYYYRDDRIISKGKLINQYKSLSQGCAFSSFLARYALSDIDRKLCKLDIIYARYSDDIIMIGKDSDKAYNIMIEELNKIGLNLNDNKTCFIENGKEFDFLGYRISEDKISITKSNLNKVKSRVKSLCKPKGKKLKYVIRDIYKYLLNDSHKGNWIKYYSSIVTDYDCVRSLY